MIVLSSKPCLRWGFLIPQPMTISEKVTLFLRELDLKPKAIRDLTGRRKLTEADIRNYARNWKQLMLEKGADQYTRPR